MALPLPAQAAVTDYVGRTIVEVHVQSGGVDLRDPALLDIVDTRVGQPLAMADVRETLAHLFGLGRYQDIQVDATLRDAGVVVTYRLVPLQLVRRIAFQGTLQLPESELRRTVVDRYGASPPMTRAPLVVRTLQTLYRDHGYPRAQIVPRADPGGDSGDTLVFVVEPGVRARIGAIDVDGAPLDPLPAFLDKVALKAGEPYDGVATEARLAKYADQLRTQGYYEARVSQVPHYVDQDQTVNLVVSVETGPHVEIVFQGDPLTSRERDELVPIAREHSVDEDILEDAKFGIEGHYRARGYCNPRADYQRTSAAGVLTIVFTVSHGSQCVLEEAQITGNTSIPTEELNALVNSVSGEPFNENTAGADAARIQGLYRRRGFAGVKVVADIVRGEPRAGVVPVRVRLVITEGVRSVIQSVAFDGNVALTSEFLRPVVTSTPGQPYVEPQISSDADSLAQIYLNRGYLEVSVQPNPQPTADRSGVNLHFVIHEGPQVFVDHVLIVGNSRTKTETIQREVQLKSGQPLSQQDEDETRARITALGVFRRVDISYLQLPGARTHRDVVVTVEEAPLTTIEYGGGVLGGRNLTRTANNPNGVERFEIAPRVSFGVGRRNLFGKSGSLNLFTRASFRQRGASLEDNTNVIVKNGSYGFNEYLARLSYSESQIFGTDADGSFTGGVEQARRTSFTFNRRSATVSLARRYRRTLAVSGRYTIDKTRIFDNGISAKDRPLIDRLFSQVRLSTFSSSLVRDTRSDPLEPASGALIGLDGELSARRLGSEVGFLKSFIQAFSYQRVPHSGTVAVFGARLGLATGFPRTIETVGLDGQVMTQTVDDLPASERFFAGGDTTVRGFALDRLGRPDTLDPAGFPKGGHGLIILNAELRVPVHGNFGAVGFVDVGNVFLHVNDIRLQQLRASVGFGLRYRSPIGPIRVDLGIKTDRQVIGGVRERLLAPHISLGEAF